MPRRVYNVDLDAFVSNGGILGQNCNTTLALQVIGVHDELADLLILTKDLSLFEQAVYQSSLAVIYVRDDGDISYIGANSHRAFSRFI